MVYFGDANSRSDVEKLQKTQMELLRIAARNQNNISNAIRSQIKFGEAPPTPYVDTLTAEELENDNYKTTFEAQKKLRELGLNFADASTIANSIGPGERKILITNFPSINKMITETFNIKLMTPTVFKEWFSQYIQEWNETKGLSFGNNGKFNNAIIRNPSDLSDILPSVEQLKLILDKLGNKDIEIQKKIEQLSEILTNIDSNHFDSKNSVEDNLKITRILELIEKLPTKSEMEESLYLRGNALFNYLHNMFRNLSENELKNIKESLAVVEAFSSHREISDNDIEFLLHLAIQEKSLGRIKRLGRVPKLNIINFLIKNGQINRQKFPTIKFKQNGELSETKEDKLDTVLELWFEEYMRQPDDNIYDNIDIYADDNDIEEVNPLNDNREINVLPNNLKRRNDLLIDIEKRYGKINKLRKLLNTEKDINKINLNKKKIRRRRNIYKYRY